MTKQVLLDTKPILSVGQIVQCGDDGTEDYDTGRIFELEGCMALVSWSSGVRTWSPIEDLDPVEEVQ